MTYIKNITAEFPDAYLDAFGRIRVSSPYTLLSLKQLYDSNPLFYDIAEVRGTKTSSNYNPDRASTLLSVFPFTDSRIVQQSKLRGVYQPGKSFRLFMTFVGISAGSGITKRAGYFDDNNGIFLESSNGIVQLVIRSYASGSAVDTAYDILPEGDIVLDWDKFQILDIDFEWLGGGRVRCSLNIDGQIVYLRKVGHANVLDSVYMSNPNLPVRFEIDNDGTGDGDDLETICGALLSEGGQEDIAQSTYLSRGGTSIALANEDIWTPIIAVRLKEDRTFTRINPISVDAFTTSTTNYEWALFINPTVAGTDPGATPGNWIDMDNSSLQYLIARTATNFLTGGYPVDGGYGASTNQSRSPINSSVKTFLTLGTTIAGVRDEYCLAMRNINGNGGEAYGGITLGEYY